MDASACILTDFNFTALTSLYNFQKTVECKLPLLRLCHHELASSTKNFSTSKSDDVTASYKLRSLKHFLSRGDFKPSYVNVHTDERQISKCTVSQTCQTI